MKCNALIEIICDQKTSENIDKLFAKEDKEISKSRAKYCLKKNDEGINFEVNADDAVALRAILTAITRVLSIYEKSILIK
ncbi:MAG: hypothetical protein U9R00_01585 [Patescibacteria group bacterium]|nr:hypothetical protein [Patescibacteria group bacterium]